MPNQGLQEYRTRLSEVVGSFNSANTGVIDVLNDLQLANGVKGDILEIGCYLGRSTIAFGYMLRDGEQLHVCERFPTPEADDPDFLAHTLDWYAPYTQTQFEQNYLKFHSELPQIYAHSSLELPGKVTPRSFRFVHMDGSHNPDALASDIALTRRLLVEGGIVGFSQYRSQHTLEVSAAIFGELAASSLQPLCATPECLYASWAPEPLGDPKYLLSGLERVSSVEIISSEFDGKPVPLIHSSKNGTAPGLRGLVPPVLLPLARRARTTLMRKDR